MSLGALLGFTALWLVWREKGDHGFQTKLSIWVAALYWFAQATGALYPGAAFSDPEFRSRPIQHLPGTRIPSQLGLEAVLLSLLGLGAVVVRGDKIDLSMICNALAVLVSVTARDDREPLKPLPCQTCDHLG